METVIYRKSDKLVAGIVPERVGRTTRTKAIMVEIVNILNSELGGQVEDYAVVHYTERPDGYLPVITSDGSVIFEPDLVREDRIALRASAVRKLEALGLFPEEIAAIFRQ